MNDTIAAIASGMTASGIGIVRISGPGAFPVLKEIFVPARGDDPLSFPANTIHYGWIAEDRGGSADKTVIDECLVMAMRAPRTYTTEDTVEIDCHGGPYVMRKVLECVIRHGARIAEPGEFTRRAFEGGRIDLTEAEAVMDVIGAKNEDALACSLRQLRGSVRDEITALRGEIMDELAYIEAALDDPEHYDLTGYPAELSGRIEPLCRRIDKLAASFDEGRLLRDGILTVIIGKPNAGKSSLLNALAGEDRAIVTDIAGTTRDVLEEQVVLDGVTLRLLDTAGIREARDEIEKIGIGRARKYAAEADLVLAVIDASVLPDDNDREILELASGCRSIILLNKSDLPQAVTPETLSLPANQKVLTVSARRGDGISALGGTIRDMFFSGGISFHEETVLTTARQRDAVMRAGNSLKLVRESIREKLPEDFFSIDLMDAYRALGEAIGEEVDDDLVNTVFEKFCMGK